MYDNLSILQPRLRLALTSADIGRSMFSVAVGLLAMGGNGFILLLVIKYRSLRKNDCIYLIACLALCDFVVGLGLIVFGCGAIYLRTMITYYPSRFECMFFGVVGIFGVQASQLATLAIAYDRFSAMNSTVYQQKDHTVEAARWVVFILVFSTLAAGAMFVGVDFDDSPRLCNAGASVTPVWATYWASFSLINGTAIVVLYACGYQQMMRRYRDVQGDHQLKDAIEVQKAVSASISIIMVVYAVCWLLPCVGLFLFGVLQLPKLYGTLSPIAAIGSAVNSSVNVFIYGLKHREISAHMSKFWQTMRGDKNAQAQAQNKLFTTTNRRTLD